jgi:hypothetical protein
MAKPKAESDRIAENMRRREFSSPIQGAGRRFTLAAALIVLSVALGLLLVWQTSSSLLIIFAHSAQLSLLAKRCD